MQNMIKRWDEVIDDLVTGFDLTREEEKNKAYKNCLSYAEKNMAKDPLCNAFLAHAAERLGTTKVMRDVVREIVPMPDTAQMHAAYDYMDGLVITGNREGLKYLAKLLEVLADTPLSGEHVHLYWDEPPLTGETYSVTVYKEEDEWFDANAYDYYSAQEDELDRPRRDLDPRRVIAMQFLAPLCSTLEVSAGKVYLVEEVVKRCSEDVWTKLIRDDESRLWVFTIRDDSGEKTRLALDIDDPEMLFLTKNELEQFIC